jgi:hypothetical protein
MRSAHTETQKDRCHHHAKCNIRHSLHRFSSHPNFPETVSFKVGATAKALSF